VGGLTARTYPVHDTNHRSGSNNIEERTENMSLWQKLFGGTNTPSQPKQALTSSAPASVPKSTTEQPHVHVDDSNSLVSKLGEDANIRADATEALGKLADPRAFEPLVRCLRDPSAEVRARACIALRKLNDKRAVEPLIQALRDDHEFVGKHAAEALGSLGDKRAVPPLENAAANKDRFLVSVSANMALQAIRDLENNPRPSPSTVSEAMQVDAATVVDNKANLVWARDANLAGKSMTFQDAVRFVGELNVKGHGGFKDWRLPTLEELKALMLYAKSQPAKSPHEMLKAIGFTNVQRDYWSSTDAPVTFSFEKECAWVMTVSNGLPGGAAKHYENSVWPVRSKS
jgi:hypothetical protein